MRRMLFSEPPLFLALLILISGPALSAQNTAVPITLGHSAVALDGPWRFHIGDNPQWASPNFDDSSWETTEVGVAAGSYDPNFGTPGYVPGWTGKGHPGYSGFAWYRIRVHLSGVDGPLSLLAPSGDVDDGYQIFVNGRFLGSFGDFSVSPPSTIYTRPRMFQIPASVLRNSSGGDLEIAFRFYMTPLSLEQQIGSPGGMHNPPYIGLASAVAAAYHVQWENKYRFLTTWIISFLIYLLFALLILMLYVFDRAERILLLPLAACSSFGIFMLLELMRGTATLLMSVTGGYIEGVLGPSVVVLWAITWWAYFGLGQKKWIRNAIFVWGGYRLCTTLLFMYLITSSPRIPQAVFTASDVAGAIAGTAYTAIVLLIAWFGIRKAQKVDWMLLLALIFYALPALSPIYNALHIRTVWFPFGLYIQLAVFTSLASLFCFSFVLMRRFRASQRRQQAVLEDVKQAQEVQQVLIPEELPKIPGLTIESEYRPAREVGGDFFQIIPHPTDGSVLIVAGDVVGKGLKAGMLVAVIVGAIRSTAELDPDPVFVLQALNRRMMGRGDAHATALAMRIASGGSVTLANAGHLPPYINGKTMPIDGALPLGFVQNLEPSVTRFQLNEDDRMVLTSDGVAEAMDAEGHLFGFDRIEQLLTGKQGKLSPADLASAAQSFGQQDDISVIAVTRTAHQEAFA